MHKLAMKLQKLIGITKEILETEIYSFLVTFVLKFCYIGAFGYKCH